MIALEYTVNISDNAASELEGVVAYIAERFAAPHAMASLLAAYDMAIDALSVNPRAYSVDEGMSKLVGVEIRRIAVKRHIMRYSIIEEANEVRVYSFLHMLQDAPKRFVIDYLDAAFE